MKLTELPVSIRASAWTSITIIETIAVLRLDGDAAEKLELVEKKTTLLVVLPAGRHTLKKCPTLPQF